MMKLSLLLMIFLSGCQTSGVIVKQRFLDLDLNSVREIDGKKYISMDDSFCLIREYEISRDQLGPKEKFNSSPLIECNKINGYSAKDYTAVFELQNRVREEIISHGH